MKKNRSIVGATFSVVCALEETKQRGKVATRRGLREAGYKLSEAELNSYYELCVSELGMDITGRRERPEVVEDPHAEERRLYNER